MQNYSMIGGMQYELIREIFNQCSGNQMRDVFVSEVETDDTDAYIKPFLVGDKVVCEKTKTDTSIIYDLDLDGLKERFSFTI
ncbi:MAG: hypothetical protein Ta2G_20940 [Termitinemataceae bacterium]|nr:MAG: hypothetical protein Ta2G_20940 [Termitinemataceae bacterium]